MSKTILVLGTGNTVVEDAIVAGGDQVHILVPASTAADRRAAAAPGTEVFAIEHWGDQAALRALVPQLPPLDGIATSDEQCIEDACYLAERLGVPVLPGLTAEQATHFRDKARMKSVIHNAGIRTPMHAVVDRAEEIPALALQLGWPLLAKPRAGAATAGVLPIYDAKHLQRLITAGAFDTAPHDTIGRFAAGPFTRSLHDSPNGFMVEPYLQVDHEWVADVWVHNRKPLTTQVMHYGSPLLSTVGQHGYTTLLPDDHPGADELAALAEESVAVLGLATGVAHTELLQVGEYIYFGESGARLPGGGIWQLYAHQHGWDVPAAMADLITGRTPKLAPAPRYRYLSTLFLAAPPGQVLDVATPAELLDVPGIVAAHHTLAAGDETPPTFGTMSTAGSIIFASDTFEDVDRDVTRILQALRLDVAEMDTAGAAR